jgi:hypothetical protein
MGCGSEPSLHALDVEHKGNNVARNKQQKKTIWGRIGKAPAINSPRQRARHRLLLCESLEDRRLLSGITSLSGHVFHAANVTDSTYSTQAGVAGAAVELIDTSLANVTYSQVAVTDASGGFSFTGLNSGDNYEAVVRAPVGYASFTTADVYNNPSTLPAGDTLGQTPILTSGTLNVGIYGSVNYAFASTLAGSQINGYATALAGNQVYNTASVGNNVATDASGNAYVTGSYKFTADFDPGLGVSDTAGNATVGGSAFVAKYTSLGALQWATGIGSSSGTATACGVAVDSGGCVYVTGFFSGTVNFDNGLANNATAAVTTLSDSNPGYDVFVAKYDPNGNLLWAEAANQSAGSASTYYDEGRNLLVDGSTNTIFVSGTFNNAITGTTDNGGIPHPLSSNLTDNSTGTGVFTLEFSPSGNLVYGKGWSGTGATNAVSDGLALSPSGNDIYSMGTFQGSVTLGSTTLTASVGTGIFVADFNLPSKGFAWADALGQTPVPGRFAVSNTINSAGAIAVDTTGTSLTNPNYGDIYVAGTIISTTSQSTLVVDEISSSGVQGANYPDFPYQATGSGTSVANSIAIVPNAASHTGYVEVGGDFAGTVGFNPASGSSSLTSSGATDGFVAQFSPGGMGANLACQWVASVSSQTNDHNAVDGLALDASGNAYATGSFQGTATILGNSFTVQPSGSTNAFLIKFGPAPVFTLTGPGAETFVAGQTVTIQWTAASVDVAAPTKISLGYDTDATAFDANQRWIEIDGITAANGTVAYGWNTAGVAPGVYYLSGYMYDPSTGQAVYSHLDTSIAIGPPAFTLTGPTSGTFSAGRGVTIQWTAANVDVTGPSKISLGYDADTTAFDANQHWIEVDQVTAANGVGSYAWNTTGVAAGTYYLSGYMYDFSNGEAVFSHLTAPIVITGSVPPAFTLTGPSVGTFVAGQSITIQWTAANVDVTGPTKISLGYDPDSTAFDANQHWIEVDGVTAANGTGTYRWNTTGVASGTYYLSGYMYDFSTSKAVYSQLATQEGLIHPVAIVITGGAPPAFTLAGPSAGTFTSGTSVTIQWTATNVDVAGLTKITLGYDADAAAFDAHEVWIEIDGVTAANGTGSYAWNTTGVAAGTYYLSGYMFDFSTSKAVYSNLTTSIVIT